MSCASSCRVSWLGFKRPFLSSASLLEGRDFLFLDVEAILDNEEELGRPWGRRWASGYPERQKQEVKQLSWDKA